MFSEFRIMILAQSITEPPLLFLLASTVAVFGSRYSQALLGYRV